MRQSVFLLCPSSFVYRALYFHAQRCYFAPWEFQRCVRRERELSPFLDFVFEHFDQLRLMDLRRFMISIGEGGGDVSDAVGVG